MLLMAELNLIMQLWCCYVAVLLLASLQPALQAWLSVNLHGIQSVYYISQ